MRKKADTEKPGASAAASSTDKATWGESLKEARISMGMSLKEAAEVVGITKAYWLFCERGERVPSAPMAAFMAMVVGLDKDMADAGVGIALGNRFDSKGAESWERLVMASIAATGLDVKMAARSEKGADIMVTLPDGRIAGVAVKLRR